MILSSFFWGYAAGNVAGGPLVKRYEPKVLLTWTIGIGSVFTIFTYQLAELGSWQVNPSIIK